MIHELFKLVLDGYGDAAGGKATADHPMRSVFRDLQSTFSASAPVQERPHLTVQFGIGRGIVADVPWVSFLDDRETTTTQEGVYCVYLFRADMSGLYLTLNQGVTRPRERLKRGATDFLTGVAQEVRAVSASLAESGFQLDNDIDLASDGNLARGYVVGTIAHRFYSSTALPSDAELLGDLEASLRAYENYVEYKASLHSDSDTTGLDALKARFLARMPGFHDMAARSGPYWERERQYKEELISLFHAQLGRDIFSGARDQDGADRIVERSIALFTTKLPSTGSPQNLVGWRMHGVLKELNAGQRLRFAAALADLLYGDEAGPDRLQRFNEVLWELKEAANYAPGYAITRSLSTLFLMLADPRQDIFVKTEAYQHVMRELGEEGFSNQPFSADEYRRVLAISGHLFEAFQKWGWKPQDLIDVQSFIWVVASDSYDPTNVEAEPVTIPNKDLQAAHESFLRCLEDSHLHFGEQHVSLTRSFLTSLATKRFAILTGLSGSGKTQLALRFGDWLDRCELIAVRPDWTGPEFLLGYEDALRPEVAGRRAWTVPRALSFMLEAAGDPDQPYLLILDEMNLAHVERYFADVLSGMESNTGVLPNLHQEGALWRPTIGGPATIAVPDNLFIVGTVNVDETTYMFSPKVLDRANTFEFRVGVEDLTVRGSKPVASKAGPDELVRGFLELSREDVDPTDGQDSAASTVAAALKRLHSVLSPASFEFGHRVFFEALRYATLLEAAGEDDPWVAVDCQVMQKILPRLHGSRRALEPTLRAVGQFCFDPTGTDDGATFDPEQPPTDSEPRLPISFDKVRRMTIRLRANQFVSFTE